VFEAVHPKGADAPGRGRAGVTTANVHAISGVEKLCKPGSKTLDVPRQIVPTGRRRQRPVPRPVCPGTGSFAASTARVKDYDRAEG